MYNPELDAMRQEIQDEINVIRRLFTEERKNLRKEQVDGDSKLDDRLRRVEQDVATIKAIQRPIWLAVGALFGAAITKLLEWVGAK